MPRSGIPYERLSNSDLKEDVPRRRCLCKPRIITIMAVTVTAVLVVVGIAIFVRNSSAAEALAREKDSEYWLSVGRDELQTTLQERQLGEAKNVILFLGDGMGPSSVTAGRILAGQLSGAPGEESRLSFDKFPHTGLSLTYNTNTQVTDSAASATAYLTGVKTNQGVLGLDGKSVRTDCGASADAARVTSILRWSLAAGKSAGVITTTRITHATPAGSYAHTPERNWESDSDIPEGHKECEDIALQLVTRNSDINVIMGGGRKSFYPVDFEDPYAESDSKSHRRTDGRNLVEEWQTDKRRRKVSHRVVFDREGLNGVDPTKTDYLLALFNEDHMQYEKQRNRTKEPSLAEMTEKAIQILSKNKKGFFLLVEGGRIDHAHHESKPSLALHDVVSLADAVSAAQRVTSKEDTLSVVTADHSHTMTISGYPTRGNPILGIDNVSPMDHMPYTTLMYANGPGHSSPRQNITGVDTEADEYVSQATVPLGWETHAGEDVAIYAHGPQSFMFVGAHEQSYIPVAMAFASCVGPYSPDSGYKCARDYTPTTHSSNPAQSCPPPGGNGVPLTSVISSTLVILCLSLHGLRFKF